VPVLSAIRRNGPALNSHPTLPREVSADNRIVIPERYWRPFADVIWSKTGRVVIAIGVLVYGLVTWGLIATAKGTGEAAIFISIALLVEQAWKRRPHRRRPA
jgi:hypothetical protein